MKALPPERSQSFHCLLTPTFFPLQQTDPLRLETEDVPWDWQQVRARCLSEARRFVGHAEAEDAVQEAFIRAWRNRHRFRSDHAPLPWLLQITRREALRIRERSSRRQELDLELVPEDRLGAMETDVHPTLAVQALVEGLAPDDRRLLELRYEHDLTQGQVADCLGIPEGTVKVRLHRLRKRLRVTWESEQ
jgi:RNA polymerase sigma-70 factor, ECF subfamily